jgi:mannose-6-phosphate isomerase
VSGLEQETRPWGAFTVLEHSERHKVKRIVVRPGHRLSYQAHSRRAEHWFVVSGEGHVTLDGAKLAVTPGTSVDVATGVPHRIENTGTEELVFIEVQHGDYFGEDDIVRFEDDFGRADD